MQMAYSNMQILNGCKRFLWQYFFQREASPLSVYHGSEGLWWWWQSSQEQGGPRHHFLASPSQGGEDDWGFLKGNETQREGRSKIQTRTYFKRKPPILTPEWQPLGWQKIQGHSQAWKDWQSSNFPAETGGKG